MLFDQFDPLKNEMLQIMDPEGVLVKPDLKPGLNRDSLLKIYRTMVHSRVIDHKILQYQRQGRMLTYAPNLGQEAAQTGSVAATLQTDWIAVSFRELGCWLYRGTPLEKFFFYWYGNEEGMHLPEEIRILPISVPIASQLQHAVGLAYAARYRGLDDIVLGFVGDGGTSQGDFHEALNNAAVLQVPVVFLIQNNQYAISMPRHAQTRAANLALKSVAYGMPGILVDGNDVFAVYAAVREAVERARGGGGPFLVELFTYRMGAHTTSDDPTIYRSQEEVDEWKAKDPIDRFRKWLIGEGLWSDEQDRAEKETYEAQVKTTFEQVEKSEPVKLLDIFRYTYENMPDNLRRQYEARQAYFGEEA